MAALTYQQAQIAGVPLTFAAASAGGDTVFPNDHGVVLVRNSGGASINVTIAVPGNTKYGIANPDPVVAVAAAATVAIGPFPADLGDPADGLVHLTYSSVTAVTVAATTN